nr:ACP S-malonyltransferase [Lachnospiraceae bacterium]
MIGFIYAGQGSQYVGQGKDFYEANETFRSAFDRAAEVALKEGDIDIKKVSFEGPEEELSKTSITQPAMAAFASGITAMLFEKGIRPDFCMGLSLGEYGSLHAAGVFDADTLIKLLVARGRFMTEASKGRDVRMAAVLGGTREMVEECCKKAEEKFGGEKTAAPSNYNCPGQIVISGDTEAILVAEELIKEGGAKRIMPLKVSGPFHTRLMKSAGDALAIELQKAQYGAMKSRVVFNCI